MSARTACVGRRETPPDSMPRQQSNPLLNRTSVLATEVKVARCGWLLNTATPFAHVSTV